MNKTKKIIFPAIAGAIAFIGSVNDASATATVTTLELTTGGKMISTTAPTATVAAPTGTAATAAAKKVVEVVALGTSGNTAIVAGSIAAATQLCDYTAWIIGQAAGGSGTVGLTMQVVSPGGEYKIYDASNESGARSLAISNVYFLSITDEATQQKLSKKIANVTWYGPYQPAFTEAAGVSVNFKRKTTEEVEAMFAKSLA